MEPAAHEQAVRRAKAKRAVGAACLAVIVVEVAAGWLTGPLAGALLILLTVLLALQTQCVRKIQRLPVLPPAPKWPVSLDAVRMFELSIWDQPFHCASAAHQADALAGRLQLLGIDGECPVCGNHPPGGSERHGDGLGVQRDAGSTPGPSAALTRRRGSDTAPLPPVPPRAMWLGPGFPLEVTAINASRTEFVFGPPQGGAVYGPWDVIFNHLFDTGRAGAWHWQVRAALADPDVSRERIGELLRQRPTHFTADDKTLTEALFDRYIDARRSHPPRPKGGH